MGLGLLGSANAVASLLPKEFADKGWRKVGLLVTMNLVVGTFATVCAIKLLPKYIETFVYLVQYPAMIVGLLDLAFFGYNVKDYIKKFNVIGRMVDTGKFDPPPALPTPPMRTVPASAEDQAAG